MKDTIGTAYATPDYGRISPSATVRKGEGTKRISAPSEWLQANVTLADGKLTVQVSCDEGESLCFDVYNPERMKYIESIKMDIKSDDALYWNNKVFVARDTLISIYRIYDRNG